MDNSVITTKVNAALFKDPVVSGLAVSVETFKGVVQLSGLVKTGAERSRAAQLASEVTGVQKVKDDSWLR